MKIISLLFAATVWLGTIPCLVVLYGIHCAINWVLGGFVTFFYNFSRKMGMCPLILLACCLPAYGQLRFVKEVNTIAELRALNAQDVHKSISVKGYLAIGDGGGGLFYSDINGTESDNGGTIFVPNNNIGRFKRVVTGTDYDAQWWGPVLTNSVVQAAIDYVASIGGGGVRCAPGTWLIDPTNAPIHLADNVTVYGSSPTTVFFSEGSSTNYVHFQINGVTNAALLNLSLLTLQDFAPGDNTNNTGRGVEVLASTNISIRVTAEGFYTDGIYVDSASKNVTIYDVDGSLNSMRQYGGAQFRFISADADNATNVALVVNTATAWGATGSLLGAFRNNGTNAFVIGSSGGLQVGRVVAAYNNPDITSFVAYHNTDLGDSQYWAMSIGGGALSNSSGYGWFETYGDADGGNITVNGAGANYYVNSFAHTTAAGLEIQSGGTKRLIFAPWVPSGSASGGCYFFDTENTLSGGSDKIAAFYNHGALKASVAAGGQLVLGCASLDASAMLDVQSTTLGFLPPRMTKAQRDAIASPATGLIIFQTDNTPGYRYYNGAAWRQFTDLADGVGGATINATDGVIPYRSSSTTFADSPVFRVAATSIGIGTTTNILTISGVDLVYTNLSFTPAIIIRNGNGDSLSLRTSNGSASTITPSGGILDIPAIITTPSFQIDSFTIKPLAASKDLGSAAPLAQFRDGFFSRHIVWNGTTNTVFDAAGNGDPNGVVTADPGSTYRNFAGGSGTTFWVKESGTASSTGWVGK